MQSSVPPASPNLPIAQVAPESAAIAVLGASDDPTCMSWVLGSRLCVRGLRTSLDGGLDRVLTDFYRAPSGQPDYTAELDVVDLSAGVAVRNMTKVTMRWKFVMRDRSGDIVLSMAETTDGPEPFASYDQLPESAHSLVDAVLEHIANAIAESRARPTSVASASAVR
jgi:hypothetical protein